LYNIPGRSVVNITTETIIELAQIPNIVAVKEASGNLDQMSEIIEKTPDDFSLYSGDDGLTIPVLSIGGVGVISVSSHIIGNEMQEMMNQFKNGQIQEAAKKHRQLLPVMKAMFTAPNPSPVKAALNLQDVHVGTVRLPMVPLKDEQVEALQKVLQTVQREVHL